MTKLIDSPPNDLSGLIEVVEGYLDKENEKFECNFFVEISYLFDLSDNQTLGLVKKVQEHNGRDLIEPNLREHFKAHGIEYDKCFEYEKMPFDIHY